MTERIAKFRRLLMRGARGNGYRLFHPRHLYTDARRHIVLDADKARAKLDTPLVYGSLARVMAILRHWTPDTDARNLGKLCVGQDRDGSRFYYFTNEDRTLFDRIGAHRPRTAEAEVLSAMRHAVIDQILDFKNSQGRFGRQWHVDHHPVPFRQLAQNFMDDHALRYEDVRVVHPGPQPDLRWYPTRLPHDVEHAWREYHREHAQLRILTEAEHRAVTQEARRSA